MTTFFHPSQLKCLSFEFSIMEVTPFLKTSIFASALITKRKSQYSTRTLDSTRMHSSMMRTTRSSSHLLGGVSASVHARIPPWVWAWRPPPQVWARRPPRCEPGDPLPRSDPSTSPPGCGPGDPHQARPLNFPLGVGLETCKACWDTTPPLLDTCKACWDATCNAGWDTPPGQNS